MAVADLPSKGLKNRFKLKCYLNITGLASLTVTDDHSAIARTK